MVFGRGVSVGTLVGALVVVCAAVGFGSSQAAMRRAATQAVTAPWTDRARGIGSRV
jgi:hypothetical protein